MLLRRMATSAMTSVFSRLKEIGVSGATAMPWEKNQAAVLVLLFKEENDIHVLLTQRASELSTHAGEVAFPGGKRDESDANLVQTALRETWEEVGIKKEFVEVLCTLPPLFSKHLLAVTPVVAMTSQPMQTDQLHLNPTEVSSAFRIPLSTFLSSTNHRHQDGLWQGYPMRMHSWDLEEGRNVWGLTAWIGILVAKLAYDRAPDFTALAEGSPEALRLVFKK